MILRSIILFVFFKGIVTSTTKNEEEFIQKIQQILNSHLVEGEKWGMKFHFYRPGL